MNLEDLLPCPFCGSPVGYTGLGITRVRCSNDEPNENSNYCPASYSYCNVEQWQTRMTPDDIRAKAYVEGHKDGWDGKTLDYENEKWLKEIEQENMGQ